MSKLIASLQLSGGNLYQLNSGKKTSPRLRKGRLISKAGSARDKSCGVRNRTPSSTQFPQLLTALLPGSILSNCQVRDADVSLHLLSRAPYTAAVHTDQHSDPHLWSLPAEQGFVTGRCWRRALEHLL